MSEPCKSCGAERSWHDDRRDGVCVDCLSAERDELRKECEFVRDQYEKNMARLAEMAVGMTDLRSKLRRAVEAIIELEQHDPHVNLIGVAPCRARSLANSVLSENADLMASDSRTDLCRGVDEYTAREAGKEETR